MSHYEDPKYLLTDDDTAKVHYKNVHDAFAAFGESMEDLIAMAGIVTRAAYDILEEGEDVEDQAMLLRSTGRQIRRLAEGLLEVSEDRRGVMARRLTSIREAGDGEPSTTQHERDLEMAIIYKQIRQEDPEAADLIDQFMERCQARKQARRGEVSA